MAVPAAAACLVAATPSLAMARHHQQAIDMVSRTTFSDAELRGMAQKMAASQKQELAELKKHQKAGSH